MARFPQLGDLPADDAVRDALARLSTKALRTYWILEPEGHLLLRLACVQKHLKVDAATAVEKDYARALRSYLEDAVQRVASLPYRTILEVVLGVGDPAWQAKSWRRETAKVRRARAGELFREEDEDDEEPGADKDAAEAGVDGVAGDTIRQHHEPRAIKALAEVVLQDERQAKDAAASGARTR
jgi:hypothetical protein